MPLLQIKLINITTVFFAIIKAYDKNHLSYSLNSVLICQFKFLELHTYAHGVQKLWIWDGGDQPKYLLLSREGAKGQRQTIPLVVRFKQNIQITFSQICDRCCDETANFRQVFAQNVIKVFNFTLLSVIIYT